MLKLLFFSALVLAAVTFGAPIFFPLVMLMGLIWLVTLPFRLLFGLLGGVFHILFGIVGAVLAVLGVVLFLPLAPVILLALVVWGVFRLLSSRRRYTTA